MTTTKITAEATATPAQQDYLANLRAELKASTKNRITVRKGPAGMVGTIIVTEYDKATGDKATATVTPDGVVSFA
jgi:hypothetical protein